MSWTGDLLCFALDQSVISCWLHFTDDWEIWWFYEFGLYKLLDMLPGLLKGQEKMSKSDPNSAIFMEDDEVSPPWWGCML